MLNTPVLFLIFNRPDTSDRVFNQIRKAMPSRLFISSDGPRPEVEGENILVDKVRDNILKKIDWNCDVQTLFRDTNLGCCQSVSGAIDWFFNHVDRGIVLEDDCLPDISFFGFCEYLLEEYEHDTKIAGITGEFRLLSQPQYSSTYGKIPFAMIWGWATWRRAWQNYDVSMQDWDGEIRGVSGLSSLSNPSQKYFLKAFNEVVNGKIDTWDYQWFFTVLKYDQVFLHPRVNLISNIGFGKGATHTLIEDSPYANRPTEEVKLPLSLMIDGDYQKWLQRNVFRERSFKEKVLSKTRKILKNLMKRIK